MTARIILKPPAYAPGSGVSELLKDMVRTVVSETLVISTALSTDVEIFRVPAYTSVLSVKPEYTVAINGGSSDVLLTVGDTDNASALCSVELSSAIASNTALSTPKEYTADSTIHAFLTPGEGITGSVRFWITFKTDSNVQNLGR